MVNNNKILTVSYGTFSCTLEGFDDSFSTMKAIAEYFRDLASDDRYFGAEPPQLDAEMLARIAQRQISSPVQAYKNESGIVLRTNQSEPAQPAPVAADLDTAEAATDVAEPENNTAEQGEAPAAAATPDTDADTASAPEPVDVAETAQDLTPDVAETITEDVAAPAKVELEDVAETVAEPVAEAIKADVPDVVIENVIAAAVTEVKDQSEPATVAEYIEPEITKPAETVPAVDSIAAKLQRIRAVVSRNEAAAKSVDFSEDEHADAFVATPLGLGDDDYDDSDVADEAAAPVAAKIDIDETETADVMAAVSEQVAIPDVAVNEAVEDSIGDASLFGDDEGQNALDEDLDDNDDDLANLLKDVRKSTESPRRPVSARVLKVKRSDFEAAIARGELENVSDSAAEAQPVEAPKKDAAPQTSVAPETPQDSAAPKQPDSSLSEEDEAELLRELAEVEAEAAPGNMFVATASETNADDALLDDDFAYDDDDEDDFDDIQSDDFDYDESDVDDLDDIKAADVASEGSAKPSADTRPKLAPAAVDAEGDMTRLMQATDTKMADPETSSSRETYSHLRAAVAVANAEHAAGGTVGSKTDDGAYRDDLASVVRPRRPEAKSEDAQTERKARPVAARPAPLKLVAEQRVDDFAERAPRGPVRPRRVSTALVQEPIAPDTDIDGGFVQFASEMEATELPDLLEAAAAYLSFVEGRDQFSRPQLMTKVRQIDTGDFNREDGLRSFGKLLRDGKIQKTSGGRFTASDDIGFRPDERAVG